MTNQHYFIFFFQNCSFTKPVTGMFASHWVRICNPWYANTAARWTLFSEHRERERERVMKSIGKQEPVRWSLQYICRSPEINQCLLMRSDTEVRLDHSLCILGVEVYRGQRGVRGNPLITQGQCPHNSYHGPTLPQSKAYSVCSPWQ